MLATLGGFLALVLGLTILLLPLLINELSRPRDSAWGAVVLLLGLVLVTSAERLTGAPMLAVLCGGLLIGRLGSEVAQGRWQALSDEERASLLSPQRWSRSLEQLAASAASLLQSAAGLISGLVAWQAQRSQARPRGKRWVRAESGAATTAQPAAPPGSETATPTDAQPADSSDARAEAPPPSIAEAEPAASPEPLQAPGPQPAGPMADRPAAPSLPGAEGELSADAPAGVQPAEASPAEAQPAEIEPADARAAADPQAADQPPPPPQKAEAQEPGSGASEPAPQADDVRVVNDFHGIEALLEAAGSAGSTPLEPEQPPPQSAV